jgi:hypothetical protein
MSSGSGGNNQLILHDNRRIRLSKGLRKITRLTVNTAYGVISVHELPRLESLYYKADSWADRAD